MKLYRNIKKLMTQASVATAQTSTPLVVMSNPDDALADVDQGYQVVFKLTQTGGVTSPTTKAVFQTSPNNVDWFDIVESTQLAANGTVAEIKDASTALMQWVRVVTVLGGATLPSHTADVWLVSNGPFRAFTAIPE